MILLLRTQRTVASLTLIAAAALSPAPAGAADAPGARGKLDTPLQELVVEQAAGRSVAPQARSEGLTLNRSNLVAVDVSVRGGSAGAARALRAAGMEVTGRTDRAPVPIVEGWLPVDAAEAVASLGVTKSVDTVRGMDLNVGARTSEGDAAHRGPQARALGANGAGVKVGIVSDSISRVGGGVVGSQATGDLPPNVQVLVDGGAGSTDEGRAMAEIVYDTVPGVTNMAFATGFAAGPVEKAANITALRESGVKVIADDTTFLTEPFFQDGVVAQAVDTAKAADVVYAVSAGNRARQSWEGTFVPTAAGFHDFGGGDQIQSIATVPQNTTIVVSFQWGERFGGATTDLDLQLYNMANVAGGPVQTSGDDNIQNGNPRELLVFTNPSGGAVNVGLAIRRLAGAGTPFMKWIGNRGTYNIEHDVGADAIDPDSASAFGALTVAAVKHDDFGVDTPEPFSSRGPKLRLFDSNGNPLPANQRVRQKPDIAGADGVGTTVTGFDPFFGTSAAAPSVAGVAALVRSANPALSADQVSAILRSAATSCEAPGQPDSDCGFGFVAADAAVRAATATLPPSPQPQPQPTPQPQPARRHGKCSKLKGKKRAVCIKRRCGKLKRRKKKARYRACVRKVTRRR